MRGFPAVGVALEIDVFVFQRSPEPLDEHVVHPAAAPIHGDRDTDLGERAGERGRGELRALVGIEDLRLAELRQSLLERRQAERDVHRVRQPPRQNRPRRPVDDRDEIEKPAPDRNVGDVGRPDVVGPLDRHVAQEIRIDLVAGRGFARSRLRPERGDPHQAHQPLHALAVHEHALGAQHRFHPARAEKGPGGEQLVDPAHQRRFVVVGRLARPVDARARYAQKRALLPQRQRPVGAVEHRSTVRRAHLPDLRAKKSRSTVS